jgi:hypothetical protein
LGWDRETGFLDPNQRADAYGRIGSRQPQDRAPSRCTLREWKLAQPQADLVFADQRGQAMAMSTLVRRGGSRPSLQQGSLTKSGWI